MVKPCCLVGGELCNAGGWLEEYVCDARTSLRIVHVKVSGTPTDVY